MYQPYSSTRVKYHLDKNYTEMKWSLSTGLPMSHKQQMSEKCASLLSFNGLGRCPHYWLKQNTNLEPLRLANRGGTVPRTQNHCNPARFVGKKKGRYDPWMVDFGFFVWHIKGGWICTIILLITGITTHNTTSVAVEANEYHVPNLTNVIFKVV